jgi:hypothetical protein
MVQLPSDPLELSADRKFGAVNINIRPTEAKSLAAPQTEHEDQDVGGVRLVSGPGFVASAPV